MEKHIDCACGSVASLIDARKLPFAEELHTYKCKSCGLCTDRVVAVGAPEEPAPPAPKSACPVCGATDHESVKVGGFTYTACPKVRSDQVFGLSGPTFTAKALPKPAEVNIPADAKVLDARCNVCAVGQRCEGCEARLAVHAAYDRLWGKKGRMEERAQQYAAKVERETIMAEAQRDIAEARASMSDAEVQQAAMRKAMGALEGYANSAGTLFGIDAAVGNTHRLTGIQVPARASVTYLDGVRVNRAIDKRGPGWLEIDGVRRYGRVEVVDADGRVEREERETVASKRRWV